jgi:tetratricopeptide (TPR) repeat protein
MRALATSRRLLLSGVSLSAAFALFHGQLASAVVTRGDDAMRGGDLNAAIRLYDRAARLDPGSFVAADRLAFNLALHHDADSARLAIGVASRALDAGASDALLVDRAFAELQLLRWRDAERDFARAGRIARDPRYDHFAARAALRFGDRRTATNDELRALRDDPSFSPAQALLRHLR